jgi:hypothetical protein
MTETAQPLIEKACAGCLETRPMTDFYSTPREPDGYTRRCRLCVLADARRFRRERAEREAREATNRSRRRSNAI